VRASLSALALTGVLAVATQSTLARADNSSLAEELFREAREAIRDGNYAVACPKLAESQRLDPSPGTLLNLGACEEHEGRIASAWVAFRALLDTVPDNDERVPFARERIAAIEPRLPRLRLRTSGATSVPFTLSLDGTPLGIASIGAPIPLNPGAHVVAVEVPPAAPYSLQVSLREGELVERTLDIPAPAATPAAPLAPFRAPPATGSGRRTVAYVLGATGIAGIATSLVLGALALDAKSKVEQHCPNRVCDGQNWVDLGDTMRAYELWATVSFFGGVVALGGGTYFWLTARPAPPEAGKSAGAFSPVLTWGGAF
jgi:hypothetical protein